MAFVKVKDGKQVTADEIRKFLKEKVCESAWLYDLVPSFWNAFLNQLEMTFFGKTIGLNLFNFRIAFGTVY